MSATPDWSLTHRQLVSAVIALVLPDHGQNAPKLFELGYRLHSLELALADRLGRPYRLDLHLVKEGLNLSLAVDCKTSPHTLDQEQIAKYLDTPGVNVVTGSGILLRDPRDHEVDAVFVVLPVVEPVLGAMIQACATRSVSGLGLIRIEAARISLAHDELTDPDLSSSLAPGWSVSVLALPLERMPYEADSPRWELADALLQSIQAFFVTRTMEFGVEDLCTASNGLWQYMEPSHEHLRERVRQELRALRGTALRDWIERVDIGTTREERWRFTKRATSRADVLAAFARRHRKYVSIRRDEDRDPRPSDFVSIDPEQLILL